MGLCLERAIVQLSVVRIPFTAEGPPLRPVLLQQIAEGFFMFRSMRPGEIECDQDHEEQEPVTDDASNNASPPVAHWTLLPLRQEALLL